MFSDIGYVEHVDLYDNAVVGCDKEIPRNAYGGAREYVVV